MEPILLPDKYHVTATGTNQAEITIEPCYPGYGNTLGNALRRVLLSSLSGAAVTAVKIKGTTHEFSALPDVKEDIVEIILNLKRVRFTLHATDEATVTLDVSGEKKVKAKDITLTSDVELASPEAEIATLTSKTAKLQMELTIKSGRGYLPVENVEKRKLQLGTIAIDAIFTPIRTVNFRIENVRVGQMTNYDKLILTLTTDGTINPEEALKTGARILVDQFTSIASFGSSNPTSESLEEAAPAPVEPEQPVAEQPAEDIILDKPKKKKATKTKS